MATETILHGGDVHEEFLDLQAENARLRAENDDMKEYLAHALSFADNYKHALIGMWCKWQDYEATWKPIAQFLSRTAPEKA